MNIKLSNNLAQGGGPKIAVRCPGCGHNGTFESISTDLYDSGYKVWFGQRRCPNDKCHIHIFYVRRDNTGEVFTYPQETIGFDKEGIPTNVLAAFEEAIICHSNNCFIASAIMIRKTLEEICSNRSATGDNLKKRLHGKERSKMRLNFNNAYRTMENNRLAGLLAKVIRPLLGTVR